MHRNSAHFRHDGLCNASLIITLLWILIDDNFHLSRVLPFHPAHAYNSHFHHYTKLIQQQLTNTYVDPLVLLTKDYVDGASINPKYEISCQARSLCTPITRKRIMKRCILYVLSFRTMIQIVDEAQQIYLSKITSRCMQTNFAGRIDGVLRLAAHYMINNNNKIFSMILTSVELLLKSSTAIDD